MKKAALTDEYHGFDSAGDSGSYTPQIKLYKAFIISPRMDSCEWNTFYPR